MPRRLRTALRAASCAFALAAAFSLAACNDDTSDTGTGGGIGPIGDVGGDAGGRVDPAAILDDEVARRELAPLLTADGANNEFGREMLVTLAELGAAAEGLDLVRKTALAKSGDDYRDPYAAAQGLRVLVAAGDTSVHDEALALAKRLLDDPEEEANSDVVEMLAGVTGPKRKDAEALLHRIAVEGDDGDDALAAVYRLAERGGGGDPEALEKIAADGSRTDDVRAAAATGLLRAGDRRGQSLLSSLLAGRDTDDLQAVTGMAVKGAVEVLPFVRQAGAKAIARGDDAMFSAACYTLSDAFNRENGSEARALITQWLEAAPELAGPASSYALWMLGDDSQVENVTSLIRREVESAGGYDVELAALLIDEIGHRGLAGDPRWAEIVSAAAHAKYPSTGKPDQLARVQFLRVRAAIAHLRSNASR